MTATAVRKAPDASTGTATEIRTDIQGLRAVAVSLVLLYHVWPTRLTGGYIGVDVFFVISGFLITSHLLAHPPRTLRDLATFWSRRIRRLLPASLLVLLVSLVLTRLVAPDTLWANTASQVKSAALYVVNWRLANDSVDYLAAHNAPTAVQHFWSLSVEEQFYLGWPILILILCAVAFAWRLRSAIAVTLGLGAVLVGSFWYSVHETATEPAKAYFVTPTRIWELAVGGVLAALVSARAFGRQRSTEAIRLPANARVVLAWAGLAAIAWAAWTYTGKTPFPGSAAALPVLGTAAVIAAQSPMTRPSPGPLLALRPVQWLGDISYSVYLWHWPLIALLPYAVTHPGLPDRLAVVGLTLVLAHGTKRWIEDRFRTPAWGRPLRKPYLLAAAAMAVVVAAASTQLAEVHHDQSVATAAAKAKLSSHDPCFGAAALTAPPRRCHAVTSGTLVPSPLQAANDQSDAYRGGVKKSENCFAYVPSFKVKTCTFGDPHAATNVALVGNSHAGQWLPAVQGVAKTAHFKITTFLASQCAFSEIAQNFDTAAHSQACLRWVKNVEKRLAAKHFDLVIMTNRVSVGAFGHSYRQSLPYYQRGYEAVLRKLATDHLEVLDIRDTPFPRQSIPDCLAAHSDDYSQCDGTQSAWLPPDPSAQALKAVGAPHQQYVEMTRWLCPHQHCLAVIGDVPVYFDGSHMTATFNATLAPYLAPYVTRLLKA